jgi:hypothetical protein
MNIDADKIHAFIVGIESYKLGPDAALDGPAMAACELAAWLCDRGVPPKNVRLHLAPLPKNEREVSRRVGVLKLDRLDADETSIRDSVIQELGGRAGHRLVVYWCGHGFYEDEYDRRLFYSDAAQNDWRHVKLFDLFTYLRSDQFPSFPEVVGFVDACAQHTVGLHSGNLPDHLFPKGREKAGHRVFVVLSSSLGQLALKPAGLLVPLFTHELLRVLKKVPAHKWFDIEAIDASLKSRFVHLRTKGETAQTPSRYFAQDWSGSVNAIGSLTTGPAAPETKGWLAQDNLDELFTILADEYLPEAILLQLYRNSLPAIAAPRPDRTLQGIIQHLVGLPTPQNASSPIRRFVVLLADRLPASRERLRQWLSKLNNGNIGVSGDATEVVAAEQRYFISVTIRPETVVRANRSGGAAEERRLASIRTWKDGDPNPLRGGWDPDDPVTLREVNEALIGEIAALEAQLPRGAAGLGNAEILIEFCLPRVLLAEPVDEWKIPGPFEDQHLGAVHPVIVRDRQRPPRLEAQKLWKERWDRLGQSPPLLVDSFYWLKQRDRLSPREQYNEIVKDSEVRVCIAFGFKVEGECLQSEKEHCLYGPWQAGIPAAIWLRRTPDPPVQIERILEKLLRGTLIQELPRRIWQLRQEGYAKSEQERAEQTVKREITLVWDDPYRVPYDG